MSTSEIATVTRRYRERIVVLLTPDERAQYDAYEQRIRNRANARDAGRVEPTPTEQTVLDKIAADGQAATLHKQLMVVLRVETLPQ